MSRVSLVDCRGAKKSASLLAEQRAKDKQHRRNATNVWKRRTKSIAAEWVDAFKAKCGCTKCGEKDPACLDLHHLDPSTKVMAVSVMVARLVPLIEIMSEVEKCIVICANCHRKLHKRGS